MYAISYIEKRLRIEIKELMQMAKNNGNGLLLPKPDEQTPASAACELRYWGLLTKRK